MQAVQTVVAHGGVVVGPAVGPGGPGLLIGPV